MVIGVTGGYCTGKSTVVQAFQKLGARIIDLDKLAHSCLEPGTKSFKKIIQVFGREILFGGKISRKLLAQEAFASKSGLSKLNSIIHPIVIRQMVSLIKKYKKGGRAIAVEAPLLFEAGLKKYFDYVVVVKTSRKNQLIRARKKTGLGKDEILKRINSQWPLKKKADRADFIIDSDKPIKEVCGQTKSIWDSILSL